MNTNRGMLKKAYAFFNKAEVEGLPFTLEDISFATGWSLKTVSSYRSKKWYWFLDEKDNRFICRGLINIHLETFMQLHAQRINLENYNLRPRFGQKVDNLIDKARESALLAVQIYNNPLTNFRTPGYLAFMHIAFTSLFHAIFEYKVVD